MAKEFRQHWLGLISLLAFSLIVYGLIRAGSSNVAAHSSNTVVSSDLPHEADHVLQGAVYDTTGGWSSSLLLLNAEGKAVTARVTLYNKHGAALIVPDIALEPYKSGSWNVSDWIGRTEGFETGSLTVLYHGLSMGLHAQETVTNQNRSLSFDVHFEEAMEFMSSTVDGLWWALEDQSDARVFIANTRVTQTIVTPTFYVGGVAHEGEQLVLNGHESDVIDIEKELKKFHVTATIGGISLSYTNGPGALATVGVISNEHTGFSTTMRFVDHMMGATASLHGANIMIGKPESNPGFPSTSRFTPHVVLRNVTSQPVQVSGRIRYTLLDQPHTSELGAVTLVANEARELDLSSAITAIGENDVTDTGIELDYAASPGAVIAYAASVDQAGSNVFDVPIKDPMGMNFKGGANPWKIDGSNRAVLHIKNVNIPDGKKHEFTVSIYFDGGVYNLPVQAVEAGQTAEIDIKKLRDDQIQDGSGTVIPLTVTSGQLSWFPRARKGDFIGRLVQYDPEAGMASSFSCSEPCWCGPDYGSGYLLPTSYNGVPGDIFQVTAFEIDVDCHGWPHGPYQVSANFGTNDTGVAFVLGQNYVYLADGGSTEVIGLWDSSYTAGETCEQWDDASGWCEVPQCDEQPITGSAQMPLTSNTVDIQLNGNMVTGQTINVTVGQEMNLTTVVQPSNATVANSQWTVPGGDSDQAPVTFNVTVPSPATPTVSLGTNGQLSISNIGDCAGGPVGPAMVFGSISGPLPQPGCVYSGNAGIIFSPPTTTTPPGAFFFLQLLTGDTVIYSRTGATLTCTATPGLDGDYPYQGKTGQLVNDAPYTPLPSTYTNVSRNFAATMYLMWQSNTSGSIPVPMGSVGWGFSGSTTQSSGTWSTPSGSGSNQAFAPASGVQSFPQWSGLAVTADHNCH